MTDEMTKQEIDGLIMAWNDQKVALDHAKTKEAELRTQVVAALFDPSSMGTTKRTLGKGWTLKVNVPKNVKMVKDEDAIRKALSQFTDGKEIGLVKWEGKLVSSVYKTLDEEDQRIINTVITTTPGAPQLELIAPTAKNVADVWLRNQTGTHLEL